MTESNEINSMIAKIRQMDDAMQTVEKAPEVKTPEVKTPEVKKDEPSHQNRKLSLFTKIVSGTITDEDIPEYVLQDWTRSLFGSIPFTYEICLYKGTDHELRAVFSDPGKKYSVAFRKISELLSDRSTTLMKLSVLTYLKEFKGAYKYVMPEQEWMLDKDIQRNFQKIVNHVDDATDKLYEDLPDNVARYIPSLWIVYSGLVTYLTNKGLPEDF